MKAFNVYDLKKGVLGIYEKLFEKGRTNVPKALLTYQDRQKPKGK